LDDVTVVAALKKFDGHRKNAADHLGVSERTLYRYMKQLRLQ